METLTKQQIEQFNRMRQALILISEHYSTPEELREESELEYGLDYEEALEMSYENIKYEAEKAVKGVKAIN